MLAVSADQKQFQLLLNLNTKMLALWICAHEDNTSCPNILKEKQKDLGKSSKKHLRGAAAAELLRTLWDLDFSELKSLLLSSLGATYALPNAENFSQFTFAAAPTVSADLQIIGNPVVSKSQKAVISQKPAKVEKKQAPTPAPAPTDACALKTDCLEASPRKLVQQQALEVRSHPAAMSLKQLVSSANFVYLQPDSKALEYFADLGFANIAVAKGKPLSHNDRVQKMVNQLINNEVNAILLGRVLFDYNNPADIVAYDLNYGTAYIQPGIVTFPTPLQKSNNFVKCVWFECSSPNSEVQVPPEIHLQFINPSPPYVPFHGWDECNPNPIHLFSQQQFENGLTFFFRYTTISRW